MNRDLIHVFMAILEPFTSSQLPLTPFHWQPFVCLWIAEKCQVKCLYVVSCLQKSLGYSSGRKQSEQGSKSQDPEPELPCAANQNVLSGEFWMLYNVSKLQAAKLYISLYIRLWYLNVWFGLLHSTYLVCINHRAHTGSHMRKPESGWLLYPSRSASSS